jgi:hypothetical protein
VPAPAPRTRTQAVDDDRTRTISVFGISLEAADTTDRCEFDPSARAIRIPRKPPAHAGIPSNGGHVVRHRETARDHSQPNRAHPCSGRPFGWAHHQRQPEPSPRSGSVMALGLVPVAAVTRTYGRAYNQLFRVKRISNRRAVS